MYGYSNLNFNLRWKHHFNNKLIAYFSGGADRYQYEVNSEKNKVNAYTLAFDINQLHLRSDFSYVANSKHTFEFGANAIRYTLHPGSFKPNGVASLVTPDIVSPEQALETAIYISDRYTVSSKLSLNGGIRYSIFNYLGAKEVNYYASGLPKDETNVIEKKTYGAGDFIHTYHGPEFRISARYALSGSLSVKAGFNSQRQYIHMLSNTTAIAPR